MNWDALGAIGELIGAVAVLLTLIYLAIQSRQNNELVKFHVLQTEDNLENFLLDYANLITTNDKLGETNGNLMELVYTGKRPKTLTGERIVLATYGLMPLKTALQNTFFRYKKGMISKSIYEADCVKWIHDFGGHMLLLDLPMTEEFKEEVRRLCTNRHETEIAHLGAEANMQHYENWRNVHYGKKLRDYFIW